MDIRLSMKGYAICTEPRSGSTYLGQILRSTGVLGRPSEYFNADTIRNAMGIADYPAVPEEQIALTPKLAATPNGVYGVKLFANHADYAKTAGWAERLPNLHFIHLVRLDVLGQAISHMRAAQTWQWTKRLEVRNAPVYNFDVINKEVVRILNAQNRWRYFFARNGMPVLHLAYEQICQTPQETAAAVGRFLGLSEIPRADMSQVTVEVQRDSLNDEWRARYLAEARNLSVFH
jgi:LPS sulfotransferase NodH